MDNDLNTLLKLLMAIGGLVFFCGGIWSARDSVLIQLRKGLAIGRVIESRFIRRTGSDSDREAHILISFKAPDQRTLRFEQAAPGGVFTQHSAQSVHALKGRAVEVYFDRKNPERASMTPLRDCVWGIVLSLAGLMVFLAVTLAWENITF